MSLKCSHLNKNRGIYTAEIVFVFFWLIERNAYHLNLVVGVLLDHRM